MGDPVDPPGQPADDDVAGPHQPDDQRDRGVTPVDRVGPGADDGDPRPMQQLGPTPQVEDRRRLSQDLECCRVIRAVELKAVGAAHGPKSGPELSTERHRADARRRRRTGIFLRSRTRD